MSRPLTPIEPKPDSPCKLDARRVERRVNEERNSAMAYVVVLPPPFYQLLRYHISETKQEAARCTLCQHRSPDECSTIKTGRAISPRLLASGATTHLYARRREAMVAEVGVVVAQPGAQS